MYGDIKTHLQQEIESIKDTEKVEISKIDTASAEVKVENSVEDSINNEADDLKKIEEIGPKIASTLTEAGISTFADLAKTDAAKISEIIANVRGNHVTDTWPKQAGLAAEGKWDELKKWQDELDGGKA